MRLPFLSRQSNPLDAEAYELLETDEAGAYDEDLGLETPYGYPQPRYHRPRRKAPTGRSCRRITFLSLLGILAALLFAFLLSRIIPYTLPRGPYGVVNASELESLPESLQNLHDLYARQSRTLREASARYTLKTNRPPPTNYDKWFDYARRQSCLIDEYDQIHRDFEPFYQLLEREPDFFRKRVDLGIRRAKSINNGNELKTGEFSGRSFLFTDDHWTLYNADWPKTMDRIAHLMPDMKIILNGRDEPRILFNIRNPPTIEEQIYNALHLTDDDTFNHRPSPIYQLYKTEKKCILPNKPTGFTSDANNASAFLIESSSKDFTTDFYPILSVTKITPCFSDILVPSEFYYSDSGWSPKYGHGNGVSWEKKKSKLYWRGASSGGFITSDDDYHNFPRFRLVDLGRNHTDLMDVALTVFQDSLCGQGCNADSIRNEYGITGQGAPREEQYDYKYLMDVDGNSFSGRYLGLMRSGSLVFKSTVFSEYFNDWIRPFEHYIPVLPDLSDLVEKLEWAVKNDEEARRIQEAGKAVAERVLTDAQNDCYFALVLLEWANLVHYGD